MNPILSIILPVYNEEEIISKTYESVTQIVKSLHFSYEILFIDDGSNDRSFEILSEIAATDSNIKIIRFSRNFGHQAALTAGLDHVTGNAIIIMDSDLQHPPELIPTLVKKWQEGNKVVNTVRIYGKDEAILKRSTSSVFYKLINKLAQIKIPSGAADFKLFDRKVVANLRSFKERARFLRGLSMWVGFRQTIIEYHVKPRSAGVSKYSIAKMIKLAIDGVTSFSTFPLKLATYLGFLVSLVSFSYLIYALYVKLVASLALPGWASIVIPILFLGGIQLITIGIVGEYLGRIYEEVKERPIYIIEKTCGFGENGGE